MKNIRTLVVLFVLAAFLAGTAFATTSSINPNVPAQNSPLSSAVLRGNFGAGYNDINTLFGIDTLSSNQLLGTVNAGMAGALNVPSCAAGALSWTPGTGFGCNSLSGLVSPITQSLIFTGNVAFNLNSTTLPTKQVGTDLQIGNADTIASRLENDAFAAPAYFTGVRADGTNAGPTAVQSGDELAGFNSFGYNGSSVVGPRASLREFASQNWTGSAQGTRVDIATTLNSTTTMAPVCGFENDGGVTCPPTVPGGDQGAGKINAAGLFVNGVAVSTGNSSLSALTAALGANSIENGANAQVWNFDALTNQTALQITGTGVTTGELFNASVANAASTGYAGYFSNTGTAASYALYSTDASTGVGYGHYSAITGASNSGYGVYGLNSGSSNTGYGVYGSNASSTGYAVYANGNAGVTSALNFVGTTTATAATSQIFSPAAGALELSTSTQKFIMTNGGLFGIGTTTPSASSIVDIEAPISNLTGASIILNNSFSGPSNLMELLAANLGSGQSTNIYFGKSITSNNGFDNGFIYEGNGSNNNAYLMAPIGVNLGLYVFANSHVLVDTKNNSLQTTANPDDFDVTGSIGMTTTGAVPTTGMYSPTTGALALSTTGLPQFSIAATGVITYNAANYASCTGFTSNGSGLIACTSSDRNLKNDRGTITPEEGLNSVLALPDAHRFEFKEGAGPVGMHHGFFAQDIQEAQPELVHVGAPTNYTPDGTLQFDKSEEVADLVQAVKALQHEVETTTAFSNNPCDQFGWFGRWIMGCR